MLPQTSYPKSDKYLTSTKVWVLLLNSLYKTEEKGLLNLNHMFVNLYLNEKQIKIHLTTQWHDLIK
jgi:hypothetical protein